MKRKMCIISAILMVALMVTGCSGKKTRSYTMSNNDKISITLDTSDKFDISSDVPFIISRDKEELCKGSFLGLDAYYTELDAAQYDEYYTIIDSGSDDDIEYTFYSSEDEYDYLIHLKDSQTAIMLQNDVSEASAKECFARLNFKFTH